MNDGERARALAEALLGEVGLTPDVLAALEQSFAAVRADERRQCALVVEDLRSAYVSKSVRTILHILHERIALRGGWS